MNARDRLPVEITPLIRHYSDTFLMTALVKMTMILFAREIPEYTDFPKRDAVDAMMRKIYDHVDLYGRESVKILAAHQKCSADADKKTVGAAELFIYDDVAILQNLAVRHSQQRRGIGSFLLHMAENSALYGGAKTVKFCDNENNRGFYEKCGYLVEDLDDGRIKGSKTLPPFRGV